MLRPAPNPILQAQQLHRKGQHEAADAEYAKIDRSNGAETYQDALVGRAEIAVILGRPDQAIAFAKQAEAVDPARFRKAKNLRYQAIFQAYVVREALPQPEAPVGLEGRGGSLVILSRSNVLTAYTASDRKATWTRNLGNVRSEQRVRPLVVGERVVAVRRASSVDELEVVAYGIHDGEPLWSHRIGWTLAPVNLASEGQRVYAAASRVGRRDGRSVSPRENYVVALDLAAGAEVWRTPLGAETGPLAAGPAGIFLRTKDGSLHGLSATDGASMWQLELAPKFANDTPVLAGTTLLLQTSDGVVQAIDVAQSAGTRSLERVRWRSDPFRGMELAVPAVAGDLVVVPGRQAIDGLDLATGAVRWSVPLGDIPTSYRARTVVYGPYAYVFYQDEGLAVIDATTHSLAWWFKDRGNQGRILDAGVIPGDDGLLVVGMWEQDYALMSLRPVADVTF